MMTAERKIMAAVVRADMRITRMAAVRPEADDDSRAKDHGGGRARGYADHAHRANNHWNPDRDSFSFSVVHDCESFLESQAQSRTKAEEIPMKKHSPKDIFESEDLSCAEDGDRVFILDENGKSVEVEVEDDVTDA